MNLLKTALGTALALALLGCSDNPCEDVKNELIACGQALNCDAKPEGEERNTCLAAKTAATAGSIGGLTIDPDSCDGDVETAARACVLIGPNPDKNCRCDP